LSTSISSCKNKNEKKRNVLKNVVKKNHSETKYLMPKGCFVQPFVEFGVMKPGLGEIHLEP
jgi:hypothetical protein